MHRYLGRYRVKIRPGTTVVVEVHWLQAKYSDQGFKFQLGVHRYKGIEAEMRFIRAEALAATSPLSCRAIQNTNMDF